MLSLEILDQSERAGRPVVQAKGWPWPVDPVANEKLASSPLQWLGQGAQEYQLEVDSERGVLLRTEARRSGKPFAIREARSIRYDEPISPERFVFEPPPGVKVETLHEAMGRPRHHISLEEAAARMPFAILVPESVPDDWRLIVSTREAVKRSGEPATVTLSYRPGDGSVDGLMISEHSAASPQPLPSSGPGLSAWRDIDRGGVAMKVRDPDEHVAYTQLYCEREGTAVLLMSQSFDVDALVTMAVRLKRASSGPPQT